jgi:hypothetical protein
MMWLAFLTAFHIVWRSADKVNLRVNVELAAEKEFRNVGISAVNVPSDKDVLLIPQIVTVIKGGVNQLANIDNTKILAHVDYNDLLKDTTAADAEA